MEKRMGRTKATLLLLAVALVTALLVPVNAIAASGSFTGGPDEYSAYALNDHTPAAVHFTGSGITPVSLPFYVKIRYLIGTVPAGANNRGRTWNPVTGKWPQEREQWLPFPQVGVDGTGAITDGWAYVAFSDEATSGPYHLMVSLSQTGVSSTLNGTIVPPVTILDPKVNGAWVHNGVATGGSATARVRATNVESSTVLAMTGAEPNGSDDDSDTVIDDEDHGTAGPQGDFRLGVPAETTLSVTIDGAPWAPATSFKSGPADTDLAIGAADTEAPTSPGSVSVTSGDATATIAWSAASDNSAVAGYHVYRWTAAPYGVAYSMLHSRIATVGPTATSYTDSGLVNGTTYYYEVRAFDASTNVGPRSATVTAMPVYARPEVAVFPASPNGSGGWYVTAPTVTLTSPPGLTPQYSFEAVPSSWVTYTAPFEVPPGVSAISYRETDGTNPGSVGTITLKFDPVVPSAGISAPQISVPTYAGPSYPVSWWGSDALSGAAAYEVQYGPSAGGPWTPWRTYTADTSAVFTGGAGSTTYFRVRAHDAAGNASEWSVPVSTILPSDNGKSRYSSGWKTAKSSAYYMGSARYTTKKGASASVGFTQGTLYVVTKTGPKLGKMAVYYGRKRVGTVNLHASTNRNRQLVRVISRAPGSPTKTVKLVNLGTKGHTRVEIDGFLLLP